MNAETIMGSRQFNSLIQKKKVYCECIYFYGESSDTVLSVNKSDSYTVIGINKNEIKLLDDKGLRRNIPVDKCIVEISDKEIRIFDYNKRPLTETERELVKGYKDILKSASYSQDREKCQNLIESMFTSGGANYLMPPYYEKKEFFSDETMSWVGNKKEKGEMLLKYKLTIT